MRNSYIRAFRETGTQFASSPLMKLSSGERHGSARLKKREGEMTHPIDLHVGKRLRQRRRLLGLTQQKLADAVSIRFQQIQKYESGANRISASRLWALANALEVPVAYFFDGVDEAQNEGIVSNGNGVSHAAPADVFQNKDTIDLVRAYYRLNEEPRRRLLDLAKAMSGEA